MNRADVATWLAQLRALYTPETVEEAAARLERERPPSREPFSRLVADRLAELRALCELAEHLQRRRG